MSGTLSNEALKKRNAKIFKNIQDKLSSDDEAAFISAADKLSIFVSRKEAYYPEARPHVGCCVIYYSSCNSWAKRLPCL